MPRMSPLRRNNTRKASISKDGGDDEFDEAFMSHIGTMSSNEGNSKQASHLFSKYNHGRSRLSDKKKLFAIVTFIILAVLFSRHGGAQEADQQPVATELVRSKIAAQVAPKVQDPIVIAHVVSLIKCTKKSSVTGFLDAAAVLRHSLHKQSVRSGTSKYDYQMYAIVHESCAENGAMLARLGYKTIIRPSPVLIDDIAPGWYKNHVEMENCCGSAEFIKLYSYTLTDHPIAVHWDMDVAIFKPMDDLFDSIIYPENSPQGSTARSRLQLQHPQRNLPNKIDAFITRDITSAQPWESKQGAQGGFLVSRTNADHFDMYLKFIKEANYTGGRGDGSGWGSLGYGGFQGAMAYQGTVAYFYDQIVPNTAVELDVCLWNQVVADVIWRGPRRIEFKGQCREYPQPGDTHENNTPELGKCKDCRIIPVDQVNSAHYTACKKPWECLVPHPRFTKNKAEVERLSHLTNITTCGLLFKKWFDLRREFEDELEKNGGPSPSSRNGVFDPKSFGGYCSRPGGYIPIVPPPHEYDITKMYGEDPNIVKATT